MNLDDWIQRQCREAGVNLGPSRAPTSIFFSLRSNCNNLRTLCKTICSITPVREVWLKKKKNPRDGRLGVIELERAENQENLRALKKPNYFPRKMSKFWLQKRNVDRWYFSSTWVSITLRNVQITKSHSKNTDHGGTWILKFSKIAKRFLHSRGGISEFST